MVLEVNFEELAGLVRAATPFDHARLEPAFTELAGRIAAHGEPDIYTEGALEGVRTAIGAFLAVLRQDGTLPRFTLARRRHHAHEAVWALHDEFRRQCRGNSEQTC